MDSTGRQLLPSSEAKNAQQSYSLASSFMPRTWSEKLSGATLREIAPGWSCIGKEKKFTEKGDN
jgi:hypothetical protein